LSVIGYWFQRNILMGHAAGIGPNFEDEVVRAIMVVRLNGMVRGGAGVQLKIINLHLAMLNALIQLNFCSFFFLLDCDTRSRKVTKY